MADDQPIAIDEAEAVDDLKRIVEQYRRVERAQLKALRSAEQHKVDKKAVEAEQADLSALVREVANPRPLLAAAATAATPPGEGEPDGPDAWRGVSIDVLSAHGVTDALLGKLDEAGVKTLGDLADCPDLTAIHGIGEAAAEKVADAAAAWHAMHGPAEGLAADGPEGDEADDDDEGEAA